MNSDHYQREPHLSSGTGDARRPEVLYHYTNLEALELILQNRTIRLGPLDTMDDLQEVDAKDLHEYGRNTFVSCWTDDSDESIPMWSMYPGGKKGVRIALPTDPWKWFRYTPEEFGRLLNMENRSDPDAPDALLLIPIDQMLAQDWFFIEMFRIESWPSKSLLRQVEYTDDPEKLFPVIVEQDRGSLSIGNKLGIYKNTYWGFQREWRYRVLLGPSPFKDPELALRDMYSSMDAIVKEDYGKAVSHVDLTIDEEAFVEMQILTSPYFDDSGIPRLEEMVALYNPAATIMQSSLRGQIR